MITNDCLAYFIYKHQGVAYASPLIASLFEDDKQYVKFCKNFDYYINQIPVFGEPKLPVTEMGGKIVVMFLDDIEIHWPHESNQDVVLEKFLRRKDRLETPLFIWSDMQMFNKHTPEERQQLKDEFKAIPNSIFVEKDDIEVHKKESMDSRSNDNYMNVPTWLDYDVMAEHIIKTYL